MAEIPKPNDAAVSDDSARTTPSEVNEVEKPRDPPEDIAWIEMEEIRGDWSHLFGEEPG
jgi:hypothetical protein